MTEIGESVAVPAPVSTTTQVLTAIIEEITFDTTVRVAVADTEVSTPHWRIGETVEDGPHQSLRPAAYLFAARGGPTRVDIKVRIIECQNISGRATLEGALGGLMVEGEIASVSTGLHDVQASITNLPDQIRWARGDMAWGLSVPGAGMSVSLNSTRAEIFVLYDTPASYYSNGVWAEALRLVCGFPGANVVREDDPSDIAAGITRYCHRDHGLLYDAQRGAASYSLSDRSGPYKLRRYIERSEAHANCYDQAGAVQAFCGAVGVIVDWIYLNPYGFIQETDLLGYGRCNNPFFQGVGNAQVVGRNDPYRTAFGNHAFCQLSGKILDACAGPHTGTETPAQYARASIDTGTALYHGGSALYPGGFGRPGTVADMVRYGGVSAVLWS